MASIFGDVLGFDLTRFVNITSVNQLPYIAIGCFGLFLYFMYAAKANAEIGEKKEGAIGAFIAFAFILDIFYLHDVWLVTIGGVLAGLYSLLAFAGVIGAMKKLGKLGYGAAEVAKKKMAEEKAKQKELQEQNLLMKDLSAEIQEEREESLLLLNPQLTTTINKISADRSYFTNIAVGQANISALAHVLMYIRRIEEILRLKEKATAQLMTAEKIVEKEEKKEEKSVKGESKGEQTELSGESKEVREIISEARILPAQMRQQVQTAISDIQQSEARTQGVKAAEAKKTAGEAAEIKMQDFQKKMAKDLNSLQGKMLKTCGRMDKNLSVIEGAMVKGGRKRDNAVTGYPPFKFVTDYRFLVQEHEQIKQILQRVIQDEINITMDEIRNAMQDAQIDYSELNEGRLLEQAESIKANIDKMLGGKKGGKEFKQTKKAFGEIGKEVGVTQIAKSTDQRYLQTLQMKLSYLKQMQAALAAAR